MDKITLHHFVPAYYSNLTNNGLPNSHGYPLNTRNVTLTNGSGSGQKYHFEGAQVIDAYGKKMNLLFGGIKFFINQTYFLPHYGNTASLFRGRGAVKGFPTFLSVSTYSYQVINSNPRGSMDVVPGGNYNVQQELKEGFIPGLVDEKISKSNQYWDIKHGMSFIPTISALGFKNPNFNWNNRVDNRNLICNNEIYFDNYYVPETNEQHIADPDNGIYINNASAEWILEEIEKGQFGCPPICNTGIVEIPRVHCLNSNFTITLDAPLISGVTLAWDYNPSVLQMTSQTGVSASFRVIGNILSTEVKVILENPCGANKTFIKELSLGTPSVSHTIIDASVTHGTKRIEVNPGVNSPYDYSWSNNGSSYYTTTPKYLSDAYLPGPYKSLWLKIEHPCKAPQIVQFNLDITLPDDPFSAKTHSAIEVFPNPSDKVWNVSLNHSGTVFYSLMDINGKVLKTGKTQETTWQINNEQIASGVYFLKVYDEEMEELIKIIKQ